MRRSSGHTLIVRYVEASDRKHLLGRPVCGPTQASVQAGGSLGSEARIMVGLTGVRICYDQEGTRDQEELHKECERKGQSSSRRRGDMCVMAATEEVALWWHGHQRISGQCSGEPPRWFYVLALVSLVGK